MENKDLEVKLGNETMQKRPLVVGMGPAGMFCALILAENGYKPIIIDRGDRVTDRVAAMERFYSEHILDTESNIQFGAGGAGTFSDGKLLTRINDPKCSYVLEALVKFGAPEEITVKAKPHVGTDVLRTVVDNLLTHIERLGGEVILPLQADGTSRKRRRACRGLDEQGRFSCIFGRACARSQRARYLPHADRESV